MLPLPPGRQRDRRVAGARRRDGRGHRRPRAGRRGGRRRGGHRRRRQRDPYGCRRRGRWGRRGDLARRDPGAHRRRDARARERLALGAVDPAGRAGGAGPEARGLAAEDQPPARPAATAALRGRPGRGVRRDAAPRGVLERPPGGLRRRRGRAGARAAAGRGLLPLAVGRLYPRRRARRHPHADLLRAAHPGAALRGRRRQPQAAGRRARDRLAGRAPRRAADELRRTRRERRPVPGGEGAAGRRARPRHARRPHLPRRPGLALGAGARPAGHPGATLGRADRPRGGPGLRVGLAPRRRRLRARRPQRRDGRARGPRRGRHALNAG
ncbi:hypothetical protein NOCARDAX2BIS_380134 [Nocardioides sp. AX2bis]|nr:hypothetical protein NOCARDAX2BIS_380134 [Nocardioides sp. AX2bis]